jgi:hypothetical protein
MTFRKSGGSETQRLLSPFLAVLLALPSCVFGQQPAAPAETQPPMESLKVIALAGNNRMNDLERRVMTPLVVQVLDQNGRPVEGAQVVFRFPLKGPSAEFTGHLPAQTVRSNADGQAAATGWMANREAGTFQVRVTATFGNQLGETTITMSNVTRIVGDGEVKHQKKWWSSKWGKIGIVAGAAGVAAAVVLLTRGGGGAANTTITAAPGTPTIGAPH